MRVGASTRIGFVATNSITQGEQVAQLWPTLFNRCGLEIAFAHLTFAWGSDARGKAHVHVVIIGLDGREAVRSAKRLFSYPISTATLRKPTHRTLAVPVRRQRALRPAPDRAGRERASEWVAEADQWIPAN